MLLRQIRWVIHPQIFQYAKENFKKAIPYCNKIKVDFESAVWPGKMVHQVGLCCTVSSPNYKEIIEANLWNKVDISSTLLRKYDCFLIQWNQSFSGSSESPWRGISGAAPGSRLIHSCWHFIHYHHFMWLPTHSEANGDTQEKRSLPAAQIWHAAQERRECLNLCHHPAPGAWSVTAVSHQLSKEQVDA